MKVVVISYSGTVGKTTISAHVLAPRLKNAIFFSMETTNETAEQMGLDTEVMKGERFGNLFKRLLVEDSAIVDVGASNVEDFLDRMVKFEGAHEEIDFFVVPVTPDGKTQRECVQMLDALQGAGVPPEKIRVLFNRVDTDVGDEFAAIIGYAKKTGGCIANQKAAVYENEVFDLLSAKRMTIEKVLEDETDYRSLIRSLDRTKQKKELDHAMDMHSLKALAKSANRQLDTAFSSLFAA